MRIGQVSKKYGLSKDNIYYYISYGLLVPPRFNTQYVFDDETLSDLEIILKLKKMDYTLAEIHRILSLKRISGIGNSKDQEELAEIYTSKRNQCVEKIKHYEGIVSELNECIVELSKQSKEISHPTGVPLTMLNLIVCPKCGKALQISKVDIDMKYIFNGELTCSCGYEAKIEKGILITPNKNQNKEDKPDVERELYKDLPPSLISLFQRSYNWMKDELSKMDLSGKVILETYINAWFFLQNHQQYLPKSCKIIIVDKYPQTLTMYKDMIEKENYGLDILYIADSSTNFPLMNKTVDLNIDFFAVNEHNFYNKSFLLSELKPYMNENGVTLGTYFFFEKGKISMKNLLDTYPECSKDNFSLSYFEDELFFCGLNIFKHKDCGYTLDSGNNLGFSFHEKGERMHLMSYLAGIQKNKHRGL